MDRNEDVRPKVRRAVQSIEEHVSTMDTDRDLIGAALIEAGLRCVARGSEQSVSAAERKLIRAHHPNATDEDIDAHRVTPEALSYMLALLTTAARKYLDHQPEACAALDACPDDALVNGLVAAVYRHHQNAYASAADFGVSAYDVAAATITNASLLASEHGVCIEQIATIHLEGIQRALEPQGKGYGA